MIERVDVEDLLNSWRDKQAEFASKAKALKATGYYGRMAEAESDVAELIIKDLETLLLKAKG
jgi:hypothetical protein